MSVGPRQAEEPAVVQRLVPRRLALPVLVRRRRRRQARVVVAQPLAQARPERRPPRASHRSPSGRLGKHPRQVGADAAEELDRQQRAAEVHVGQALPRVADAAVHLDRGLAHRAGCRGRNTPWRPRPRRARRPVAARRRPTPRGAPTLREPSMATKASASRCCTAWNEPTGWPYCRRSFAYPTARSTAPRIVPTRSAQVMARPRAVHLVRTSSARWPTRAAPAVSTTATGRVRSTRVSPRPTATELREPSSSSTSAAHGASRVDGEGLGPVHRGRRRGPRSRPWSPAAHRRAVAARRPTSGRGRRCRRRPRPSSSAMMATSTADAHGAPSSDGDRSSRQPAAATAASSFSTRSRVVELTHRAGAEAVDEHRCRVAQRPLLGGQPDVHQPAISSSRSTRRSTLPDGRRGTASTTTTRCTCLYVASVSATSALQLALLDRRLRIELHRGDGNLAGPLVGYAEHGAVEHRRMAVQHGFDLGRCHLEAVDLDHLLAPVGEVDPALGFQPTDVAGAVPAAVDDRLGGGLVGQVSGHTRGAPGLDLTDVAGLQDRARVEVDDPQVDAGRRQPGGVEAPRRRVVDRVGGDHRQLAGAVGREPVHAGALGHGAGDALGHRRGAPHDEPQRRQVVLLEPGVVGHGESDRGDRHLEGHPLALDALQHLVEVEPPVQPHGGAGLDGGQQVQEPEDVRRRGRHLEPVVGTEPEGGAPVRRRAGDRRVRVAHRLGQPRRARTEDEHRLVLVGSRT